MGARYSNHLCVYCQSTPSGSQGDHIFARSFFLARDRRDLPKAPCCPACGDRKSRIEHYLATVLPFGGVHTKATESLEAVAPRLEKNLRLKRELAAQLDTLESRRGIDFDTDKLRELFLFITQGLLWWHGRRYLPSTHDVVVVTPSDESLQLLIQQFSSMKAERIVVNLGEGTFEYVGLTSPEDSLLSMWFYRVLGGLQLTGDPERPDAIVSAIVAITGSRDSIERISEIWGGASKSGLQRGT